MNGLYDLRVESPQPTLVSGLEESHLVVLYVSRHPFSITSAPGDDYLSVHIRTNGDWTQELKRIFVENYFSPHLNRRASFSELGAAEPRRSIDLFSHSCFFYTPHRNETEHVSFPCHSLPKLLVDGPYGAPAQDFRNYDVLLLVGLGIGATPFISILRDLLNNIKIADELMVRASSYVVSVLNFCKDASACKSLLFIANMVFCYF